MESPEKRTSPDIRDATSFSESQDLQRAQAGDTHGNPGRTGKRRVLLKVLSGGRYVYS